MSALATAPWTLPTWTALFLIAPGTLGVALFGFDHCHQHVSHVHLCLFHPSAPLTPLVGSVLLACCGAGAVIAGRTFLRLTRTIRPLRALRQVKHHTLAGGASLISSDRPFALTYGLLSPRTLISTTLLEALNPTQQTAVLAHEAEHLRRRDPLRHLIARLASTLVWPSVRREILDELLLSIEQTCDEKAAERVGDRIEVAETILAVEKLVGGHPTAGPVALGIEGGALPARVSNLLDGKPSPRPRTGWLWVAILGVWIAAAPSLHHEAEHALDIILRSF